jgi:DNA mismatch repair protein MutS
MEENGFTQSQISASGDEVSLDTINLLYPPKTRASLCDAISGLSETTWHDLGFDQVVAAFTGNKDHQKDIKEIFTRVVCDPDTIRYRQDILVDLLDNPALVDRLTSLLPVIDSLTQFSFHPEQEKNTLHEVTWRVGELQCIIDCIEGLEEILVQVQNNIASQGLQALLTAVLKVKHGQVYQNLFRNLPELLEQLRSCASITIGVNLDGHMRPIQATLLSVNTKPYTNQSLLNRLFGTAQENAGIAPLHSVPERLVNGPYALPIDPERGWAMEPMMVPLFADLAKVLEKTTAPLARALKEYAGVQGNLLIHLRRSLVFYLGAVRLVWQLQAYGLPMCRPVITGMSEQLCAIKSSYNVNLALRLGSTYDPKRITEKIITNDVNIGPDGQILILTGPNQGGKTTYMVGIGIAQLLAQAGCLVPGEQAQISPVDNIFTHFPLEEKPETDAGRFGEEAMRLGKIFEQITAHSLILLNESLSNTSFGESLYLAQDLVRIFRRLGARAIYSTHLHELANRVDALNQSVLGASQITSVVSSPVEEGSPGTLEEIKRSYKVENRPPLGQSYAREIAARYGIRYEQLEKVLSERGAI